MPLIIISGIPSSGKTTRANELSDFFKSQNIGVKIISEFEAIKKANYQKNTFYLDSQKEKQIRGVLKSEVQRHIGTNDVVILDAGNYIKGYRYEIFCATKATKCTQCTIHCEINVEEAFKFNEQRENSEEKYSREVFDALVLRYEAPEGRNRWDSPLFVVFPNDKLDMDVIKDCLFNKKPPPPNLSTQNPPLSSTNFLYELDRITQEIDRTIISSSQLGLGSSVRIPGVTDNLELDCSGLSAPQLSRLRRQFIVYTKMHTVDIEKIPLLYVQYLKSSLSAKE